MYARATVRLLSYLLAVIFVGVVLAMAIFGLRSVPRGPAPVTLRSPIPPEANLPATEPPTWHERRVVVPARSASPDPEPAEPSPATDPRRARPKRDGELWQRGNAGRLDRFVERFYSGRTLPADAHLQLVLRVASDGTIEDVRPEASTFQDPAFEAALVEEIKRTHFPDDERYAATDFSFHFKASTSPATRPIAEAQAHDAELFAALEPRGREIFATAPPPPGAQLTVIYRVAPDGAVDQARVESSSYRSAAFERVVLAEVRKLRFAPNAAYAPTEFTYRLVGSRQLETQPP